MLAQFGENAPLLGGKFRLRQRLTLCVLLDLDAKREWQFAEDVAVQFHGRVLTTLTGISLHPSRLQAARRRAPASNWLCSSTVIGWRSPMSSMLAARPSMSPRSRRWRSPTTISSIARRSAAICLL